MSEDQQGDIVRLPNQPQALVLRIHTEGHRAVRTAQTAVTGRDDKLTAFGLHPVEVLPDLCREQPFVITGKDKLQARIVDRQIPARDIRVLDAQYADSVIVPVYGDGLDHIGCKGVLPGDVYAVRPIVIHIGRQHRHASALQPVVDGVHAPPLVVELMIAEHKRIIADP